MNTLPKIKNKKKMKALALLVRINGMLSETPHRAKFMSTYSQKEKKGHLKYLHKDLHG